MSFNSLRRRVTAVGISARRCSEPSSLSRRTCASSSSGRVACLINKEWDERFLDSLAADGQAARAIPFIEYVRETGSEGIEMVMWLIARGALDEQVREVHRFYHVPCSNTALGHLILENASFRK